MDNRNLLFTKTNRLWRPAMAWLYFSICLFDFIIGPVVWAVIQQDSNTLSQWIPLTSRGGGLIHMAMMAIIGITAWGRTQEKINMSPFGIEMQRETIEMGNTEKKQANEFPDEPPPTIKRKTQK